MASADKTGSLRGRQVSVGNYHFSLTDLFAALAFLCIGLYFFLTAPYGITEIDESFYQTIVQRLTQGDKLLADDWHMVQLTAFFWYLPYRLFYWILGGTEGILLALRYFYAAQKLLFFAVVYTAFRSYGWWAILSGVIYVGMDPFGLKTMTYYSVCTNAVLLTALILFVKKEPKPLHYVFAGFVFACAVLAEPAAALIWIFYSAFVFIRFLRRRKEKPFFDAYGFVLDFRVWKYLFFGVLAAFLLFVVLCLTYFTGTDFPLLAKGVTQMIFHSEYTPGGNWLKTLRIAKLLVCANMYRSKVFFLFLLLLGVSLVVHRFTRRLDRAFLLALGGLMIYCSCYLLRYSVIIHDEAEGECVLHPFLLALFGVAVAAFTKNKNRRLWAFLLLSLAVSFCADLVSDCTLGSFLNLGNVAVVFLLRDYLREQPLYQKLLSGPRAPKERKDRSQKGAQGNARGVNVKNAVKKAAEAAVSLGLAVITLFVPGYEIAHYVYMAGMHETEGILCRSTDPLDSEITVGAYKGIRTIPQVRDAFESQTRDLQTLAAQGRQRLFVAALTPTAYLDAGIHMATYSSFAYVFDTLLFPDGAFGYDVWPQTELWWSYHPEKKPDVVYIPYVDSSFMHVDFFTAEEKLQKLQTLADVDVQKGEGGYIAQITAWK